MRLIVGFSVGVAVGAGGCYLYLSAVKKPEPRAGAKLEHPALKYGVPETEIVRDYDGFVAAYDYRTRNAKWVIEHLTPASWSGEATRERSEFFPDPGVDPRFSAKLSDFRGSGYDRGHLAPAANHKDSQKAMDETFSLVNISPQVGKGFNRDYWARFERFCKELTGKPPGLVAVPTHFYKVVLADTRGDGGKGANERPLRNGKSPLPRGSVGVGAFVLPNAPIDARTPLSAYVVPLEDLEQVAGTRFFPELLGEQRRREVLDVAAAGWRANGMAALKPFDRMTMKQAYAALPPPSGAVIDVEASPAAPASVPPAGSSVAPARPPPPKTAGGAGVSHICEVNGCTLPPPFVFKNDNEGQQKSGSAPRSR
ncbi:hypothetical protein GPECTOR_33g667 [Gonium pectorale]|uniref:Endonuclease n=1 Tax=Gonium pectorale TaxID=33097 RepID=A0A150GDX4_GONPE|nr:hypothetical protein GPECTOR_33g667 [Gonium pectorale]|eukprot:KXZ47785.1 hypothetical protein GPECTOR_33g667 [Gonium pectorale]